MFPSDPDVVVIGAGAAGIAAARALAARGLTCVVLEAGSRIGGRAHACTTLGAVFDHGATWLHAAEQNALTPHAPDAINHDRIRQRHFWMGDAWATPAELAAFQRADNAYHAAVARAASGPDRAIADVIPRGGPWDATVAHWQGAQIQAMEVEHLSAHDIAANSPDGSNLLPREGVGGVIARLAQGLPIRLDARVESLDWSGPHIIAQGGFGTLRARAAIITVSTGVLAAGGIRFTPALPATHAQAVHDLPVALLDKFAFRCPERLGIAPFHSVRCRVTEARPRPLSFVFWPHEADHVFGFAGGALAWELGGGAALVEHAREELRHIFGNPPLGAALATSWGTDPLFLGSYSQARVGAAGARGTLAQPLADGCLLFAGEATHHGMAGMVSGAWAEGERAAQAIQAR
ncbi:MAG: NAD(P)/FAD-dependent oxidoreductase [Alphaproteobacteria bacterium]|nr:NAD(P)/FAD-dependent oxidoreductase [Alphaproteobacteria bacterium]